MNPDLPSLLRAIADGQYDGHFDAIGNALNQRARALRAVESAAIAAQLVPGDRVRLNEKTRPTRMIGQEGVVTAFTRTKVSVRLDGDIVDTGVPPTLLEKIGDAVVETAAEATERLIKEFEAKHAEYPQYAGHTDGAVAVPLRKQWTHRGERLAKGTFVLLLAKDRSEHNGVTYVSIWHPHLLMTTRTAITDIVLPRGAK